MGRGYFRTFLCCRFLTCDRSVALFTDGVGRNTHLFFFRSSFRLVFPPTIFHGCSTVSLPNVKSFFRLSTIFSSLNYLCAWSGFRLAYGCRYSLLGGGVSVELEADWKP